MPKGYGFVSFADPASADQAMLHLNQQVVYDKQVTAGLGTGWRGISTATRDARQAAALWEPPRDAEAGVHLSPGSGASDQLDACGRAVCPGTARLKG